MDDLNVNFDIGGKEGRERDEQFYQARVGLILPSYSYEIQMAFKQLLGDLYYSTFLKSAE